MAGSVLGFFALFAAGVTQNCFCAMVASLAGLVTNWFIERKC
jgi:hypothetical protein